MGQVVGDGGARHASTDHDDVWLESLNGGAEVIERGHGVVVVVGRRTGGEGGGLRGLKRSGRSERRRRQTRRRLCPLSMYMCRRMLALA